MAKASAKPVVGGYDEEFVNAVDDELQCAICYSPMKEPIQTKCGHRFCKQCLDEHFKRSRTCPLENRSLGLYSGTFPDKATERKILSLVIKCPSNRCEWTGELRSKDEHLASCPLKVVSCTNKKCLVTLTRNKLQEHVTTTCEWRILKCNHCSASHTAGETETHQSECKRYPCNCPKSCGAAIPREEISLHTERDCPLTIIPCPYSKMGCTVKVQRKETETHLETATRRHLDLACLKLDETEREFRATTHALTQVNTWKITGYSKIVRKIESREKDQIESPPFYNSSYKFILLLATDRLIGTGYFRLHLKIVKGEYDAILPWPFYKKVTFTLIDQQEKLKDRRNLVKYFTTDYENKRCFARPKTDANEMDKLNYLFTSQDILKTRRYIVDDTVFIQVEFTSATWFS